MSANIFSPCALNILHRRYL